MPDQDTSLSLAFSITVGDRFAGTQEFQQEMVTIGRGDVAVLQIEDPAMAELHAAVQMGDDGTLTLLDLGSVSGTLLNGNPVGNARVGDGDAIRIGGTLLVLEVRRPRIEPSPSIPAISRPGQAQALPDPRPAQVDLAPPDISAPAGDIPDFVRGSDPACSDMGVDREAPRILEVAEIWADTVQSVQHFGADTRAVYVGDRHARPLRIAGGSLVALLLLGSALCMLRHSTLPAPPAWPDLPPEIARSLSSEAGREIRTDRDAVAYWEEVAAAGRAALAEERRLAMQAEMGEVEAEADRRMEGEPAVHRTRAAAMMAAEKARDPASTRTIDDFLPDVRRELEGEIAAEREKAREDQARMDAPPDRYAEYEQAWTKAAKAAFERAVARDPGHGCDFVPPRFDLYEKPDYEDFIAREMIPTAEVLARKGALSAAWVEEFERFDREYVRFDDVGEKRVVEDLVLGTRVMRADAPGEVLMLVAGPDASKTFAVTTDGSEIVIPQGEQVFVWDPSPAQVHDRAALYRRIQELLYVNADAKGRSASRCEALANLLSFPEHEDDFSYNAQYARCLAGRSEFERAREYVSRAMGNAPADLADDAGDDYLAAMEVRARLASLDAFGGDPLAHDTGLIPEDERVEAQRVHEDLRLWILQNRRAPGPLKAIDAGIHQLAMEELKADQGRQVGRAFALAFVVALLLPFGFGIDEIRRSRAGQHFLVDAESLPSNPFPIAEQKAGALLVNFTSDSVGFLERGNERTSTSDLVRSGRARDAGGYYQVELGDEDGFHTDVGSVGFFVHRVLRPRLAPTAPLANVDWLFCGVLLGLLFVGCTFGAVLAARPYEAGQEVITIPHRFVQLMVQPAEKEKEKRVKPQGNPDAGEGARARGEEGRVGRRDARLRKARGSKVALQKSAADKAIAEATGLLADINQMPDSSIFGTGTLDATVSATLGGLIGSQYGDQYGSGGLGSRGSGYGGGGTASGLGGLGTRGTGSGGDGFGRDGGFVGHKGGGIPGPTAGDPIVLGALEKWEIDHVVKQHLAEVRHCYERELARNPSLLGKIVIKFVIDRSGMVSTSTVRSSTMASPQVEQCVSERFLRMRFPRPKGDGIVAVSYPFVFNAAGR